MQEEAPESPRVRGLMTTRMQINANRWLRKRLAYALSIRNVRMQFDPAKWLRSVPLVAAVAIMVGIGGGFVYSLFKPQGVIGESKIVKDRDSNALYVRLNGKLYEALNMSSARLVAGGAQSVVSVPRAEIEREAQGSKLGIPGAPNDMTVTNGAGVQAAVCQRVPVNSSTAHVTVSVLDGGIVLGGRAAALAPDEAVVGALNGQTYVIFNGRKSVVDPADRIVLSALGISRSVTDRPSVLTTSLGNAIPSGLPLVAPAIPDAGIASQWKLGPSPIPVGAVITADIPGQGVKFFVVLKEGVQEITPVVAAMLRSQNAFGLSQPPQVTPDLLAAVPTVTVLEVSQFPAAPLRVVDPGVRPVTCWLWERGRTAQSATTTLIAGAELPISPLADRSVVRVASSYGEHDGADQVYLGPGAANWVIQTGNSPKAASRETMWWISPQGTRFGVDTTSANVREALGLDDEPLGMPWNILRLIPSGLPKNVALSKDDASVTHDRLAVDQSPAPIAEGMK
ncbi:type VII secretion protein EccB [Mycobacteroides abscessus subsp. abscessus]|nr:type VII secretion protein EccB [Mycobacteroides abscessus subsp. abscessus]